MNQKGIIHLHILAAVLLVFGVGVFTVMRINNSNSQAREANDQSQEVSVSEESDLQAQQEAAELEKETDEEDANKEEKDNSQSAAAPAATKRVISFVKGGDNFDGKTVAVSHTASEQLSGNCNLLFTLGNSKVDKQTSVNGSKVCDFDVPVQVFPKNGKWAYQLTYLSNDGSVSASVNGSVSISAQEFSFTKGGGDYSNGVMSVSQTTTDPQTGTCTYTFTLGNSKVQTSNKIKNSRTCSITFSDPVFPKSGNWMFDLSFSSSEYLRTGTGGGFEILVN